jgi:hypothetical protein
MLLLLLLLLLFMMMSSYRQLVYRSDLKSPDVAVGSECEDVTLFNWSDIPWDTLAFPTVAWALMHHAQYNRWTEQVSDPLNTIAVPACMHTTVLLVVTACLAGVLVHCYVVRVKV